VDSLKGGGGVAEPVVASAEGSSRGPSPLLIHITTVPMSLTFMRGQVGYMKRAGFEVRAISSPGQDLDDFSRDEDVPVDAVVMRRRITPFRDTAALVGLVRLLGRYRPTVVHAHTPKAGLLGMIAARLARVPVRIYHMRGLPLMSATGLKRQLLWCTEWLSCRLAQRVLCVSDSIRSEAIEARLCAPDKISILAGGSGNGVDAVERFDPRRQDSRVIRKGLGIPESALVVGFVGRIVRDKGIVELVRAWSELRRAYPSGHLLVVGPFEPQDPVPPDIEQQLRYDERVHLVGMDWNTPPLYASMDVVALPTYREGFPNVPLEAAAMALPVVATRIPGCTDAVVDGVTGTLVPVKDPRALKDALSAYLNDPGLRREHGQRGRERVLHEFSQPVIWSALLAEYQTLLSRVGVMSFSDPDA